MDVLRFENQEFFYLLGLMPLLLLIFIIQWWYRKRRMNRLGSPMVLLRLVPFRSIRRPWIKFFLFFLAFGSMILAAVNPQIGYRATEARRDGVDIVVALDVSRSMLAEDIRPNRLERAKMAVGRLIDRLENDRVGIVVFAGSSVTQVPITADHHAAKMLLRTVNTQTVQVQGTSIANALQRSMNAFQAEEANSRVIILVSDGENHEDDPLAMARLAAEQGIIIHTVGIGTRQGAPIPVYRNNQLSGFVRDNEDRTVISRFDEDLLRDIARQTGGMFQTGTGADLGLNPILEEIRNMEQQEYETMVFSEYESRFHYFIAIALILLLLEFIIFERKSKWLSRINLFDTKTFSKI